MKLEQTSHKTAKLAAGRMACFVAGTLLMSAWAAGTAAEAGSQLRPWREYRTILWVGDSASKRPEKLPLFYQRLREMGINTAMVSGDADPQPLLTNQFPYYVENIINRGLCLKWNSKVRDWDKFVTEWANTGRPDAALVRDYCLDDPAWLGWARQEMQTVARKNREHEPLAYDIRDELSTTLSANPFDYDFNPLTLGKFREWLKTQYPGLAALNAEWETRFGSWEEVKPFTTDQIKNRMASGDAIPRGKPDWQQLARLKFEPQAARQSPTRWNVSPWADFRAYMDRSLASALEEMRRAAREVDPRTPVGIEGTQMPHAFGGYDLWRLSQVLDWVEPYDIGDAREIFGSFMPGKPILTTVFEKDTNPAKRRLWHLLLEGDRGCIVWWSEDCLDWKSEDYRLTPKARALIPVLHEMTSPLARLFLRAERVRDAVLIHYSQPSIRVDWLLESVVDGSTWLRRFSSFETEHNRMARTRDAWLKDLQVLGYSPRFISSEQIESGGLKQAGKAVLVLPESWALSDKELAEIESFAGTSRSSKVWHGVLREGEAGLFDEHGKLRAAGKAETGGQVMPAGADRQKRREWLAGQLRAMPPEIAVPVNACVRTHRFRISRGQLVAFERAIDYRMSEELKQAGGNEALEKPVEIEATLPQPMYVYDLRAQRYLGHTDRLRFTLDPWQPSLFAVLPDKRDAAAIVDALQE
jgi:Beta-galactosidase